MFTQMLALLGLALLVSVVSAEEDEFDITEEFQINQPANFNLLGKHRCFNSLAFALVGALEIAYTKETGHLIKFAEQELIDCHYSGCNRPHITDYVAWLKTVDRLAPASKYAPYSASQEVCRSAISPDGLDEIKLTGELVTVTPENFEYSIRKYGSILACYDTNSVVCPNLFNNYQGGIVTGFPSTRCIQHVLIVGYTSLFYRVRESRGTPWGEEGYFRILRGGNNCGIEQNMQALVTEERTEPKNLDLETGCPADFPEYCAETRTCARESQDCVEDEKIRLEEEEDEDDPVYDEARTESDEGYSCFDTDRYDCEGLKDRCNKTVVKELCGGTCEVCMPASGSRCKDFDISCITLKPYCSLSPATRAKCPKSCGMKEKYCGTLAQQTRHVVVHPDPSRGKCYIPSIENGIVLNADMLGYDEVLEVECDEGFVLVGAPNTCIIQNVYGPDSRIIQECIKVGSETFTAQGFDYRGSKHTTLDGKECEFWYSIAFKGKYQHHGRIYPVDFDNHNYCRNVVDEEDDEAEPVPYCFVGGRLEYCFVFPGCSGTCEDAVDEDPAEDCADIKLCEFSDKYNVNRQKAYWKYCTATCCAAAGC